MKLAGPQRDGCVLTAGLDDGPAPASAIASVAQGRDPAILESVAGDSPWGRWSILACDPVEVLVIRAERGLDPFEVLGRRLKRYPALASSLGLPCACGWIGFISYEAGAGLEKVYPTNPPACPSPLMRWGLYDTMAFFDRAVGRWQVAAVDWPPGCGVDRPPARERLERLAEQLSCAELRTVSDGTPAARQTGIEESPAADWSRQEYVARVRAAKDYIAAGDVYQVNLTHRFVARTAATPLQLYLDLRRTNPADFAALLTWDDCGVVSSSPELFLDLHGGGVITRPIKGTRPRVGDERLDAVRRRELAGSEKERAELNMIIDLLRNDLGRVCEVGSIRVDSAGDLEAHPTVFHRVATIRGRLSRGRDAIELLRATCPGGSVTGAPKVRAMQIIDELETVQRGVYCGNIGYLGLDGSLGMNIAIRTMVVDRGRVNIHTGGAIVADSDPDEEYEETLAKAAGMFRALEGGVGVSRAQAVGAARPRRS